MARPTTGRPTDQELQILKVLWEHGPSSVRDVWKVLAENRNIGYTSVLKIMQIMLDKGLVVRDARQRPQVYRTKQTQHATLKRLAADLVERAFGGSARMLLLHVLSDKPCSQEELEEIRNLLDEIEGSKK